MKNKYSLHALMFFYFAAGAVMFPYLTIYFSKTLTPYQIGILMAIIPTAMLLLQPFWGWAADKWGIRRVLIISLSLTMTCAIGFLLVNSFVGFFIVLSTYAVFVASISSLIDSLVLSLRSDKYGSIRLWGSIGYGVGAFISGVFKSTLIGFWSFVIHICLLVITLIIILSVSNNKVLETKSNISESKIEKIKFTQRFSFLKNSNYIILLVAFFLICIIIKGYENFYPVGLNNLKVSGLLMGLSWVIEILPEIFVFYFLDKIVGKVSAWQIAITGVILYGIRMALLGLFPVLWVWLVSQPLSGFAFSFWYFGAVKIINDMVSRSQQASGQAVFWSFCYGAGGLIGSFLSGFIVNKFGTSSLFKMAAILCIISTIILIVLSKHVHSKLHKINNINAVT